MNISVTFVLSYTGRFSLHVITRATCCRSQVNVNFKLQAEEEEEGLEEVEEEGEEEGKEEESRGNQEKVEQGEEEEKEEEESGGVAGGGGAVVGGGGGQCGFLPVIPCSSSGNSPLPPPVLSVPPSGSLDPRLRRLSGLRTLSCRQQQLGAPVFPRSRLQPDPSYVDVFWLTSRCARGQRSQ